MTPLDLLDELARRGVRLSVAAGRLRGDGEAEVSDLMAVIVEHKPVLIAYVEDFECLRAEGRSEETARRLARGRLAGDGSEVFLRGVAVPALERFRDRSCRRW
jgi:hypothetical protein